MIKLKAAIELLTRSRMAGFNLITEELTWQWRLLAIILLCSLLASFIARTISRESLYAIATPEPAQ